MPRKRGAIVAEALLWPALRCQLAPVLHYQHVRLSIYIDMLRYAINQALLAPFWPFYQLQRQKKDMNAERL